MDRNLSFGYLDYIKSDAWKERAAKRKDLDGNRCARCGAKERLHTHHINYRNFRNEDVEKDLITLCADCHEYVHQNKNALQNRRHSFLSLTNEGTYENRCFVFQRK